MLCISLDATEAVSTAEIESKIIGIETGTKPLNIITFGIQNPQSQSVNLYENPIFTGSNFYQTYSINEKVESILHLTKFYKNPVVTNVGNKIFSFVLSNLTGFYFIKEFENITLKPNSFYLVSAKYQGNGLPISGHLYFKELEE